MKLRPIDIARKLNISTSTLRHYESWGMLPPVQRSANGYRIYTEEHAAYFECIRAMADGFGILLTGEVMKSIQAKDVASAFWLVNKAQSALHNEKIISEKTINNLMTKATPLSSSKKSKDYLTINEISKETGIPATTIRHWEKTGLLSIPRDNSNRYRLFTPKHIRQILVIHALKAPIYSFTYSLEGIKEIIQELDYNDIEKISKIAKDFQKHLDQINKHQMHGVHYLYGLCQKLGLLRG